MELEDGLDTGEGMYKLEIGKDSLEFLAPTVVDFQEFKIPTKLAHMPICGESSRVYCFVLFIRFTVLLCL